MQLKSNRSKVSIFSVLILFTLFNLKCDKNEEFYFPYTEFYLQFGIATDLHDLGDMDTKLFTGVDHGIGGIIIFKSFDNYFAFDAACTHEIPDKVCTVKKNSVIIWECPCCGSQFVFSSSGDYAFADVKNETDSANFALKNYKAYSDGVYVYVSN